MATRLPSSRSALASPGTKPSSATKSLNGLIEEDGSLGFVLTILAVKAGAGLAAMPHFQGDNESDLVRVVDVIGLVMSAGLRRFRVVGNQVVSRAFVERQCRNLRSSPRSQQRDGPLSRPDCPADRCVPHSHGWHIQTRMHQSDGIPQDIRKRNGPAASILSAMRHSNLFD
jgi:hypothetical protein